MTKSILKILYGLFFILSGVIFISGMLNNRIILYEGAMADQRMIPILQIGLTIIILYMIHRYRLWFDHHNLFGISIGLTTLIGLLFMQLDYPSIMNDDSAIIAQHAKAFYDLTKPGLIDFSYFDQYYYLKYPWQLTLTLFEVVLHWLTHGNAMMVLPWVNLLFVILTYGCGYSLLRMVKPHGFLSTNIYGLIILLCIIPLTYLSYPYGWQIGMGFSALSILFYVKSFNQTNILKSIGQTITSLIVLVIACLFKTNFIIIAIAYALTTLIHLFNHHKSIHIIRSLLIWIGLFIALNANTWLYSGFIGRYEAGVPKSLYLVTGLSEGSIGNGWYDGYNEIYVENDYDPDLAASIASDDLSMIIDQWIDDPLSMIEFFKEKFISTFLAKDYQSHAYYYWQQDDGFNHLYQNGWFYQFSYGINNLAFIWIFLGLTIISFIWMRHPKDDASIVQTLLCLCLLGACGYHLLFETKAIYIYPLITLVLPLASLGISHVVEYVQVSKLLFKWKHLSIAGVFLLVLALIYNHSPMIYTMNTTNYTDDLIAYPLSVGPTTLSFEFQPSKPMQLGIIELRTNGAAVQGHLSISIYDENQQLKSINKYDASKLLPGEIWNRFVIDPIELESHHLYTIEITTDLKSDGLELITGTYTPLPAISKLSNPETNLDVYLNVKLYEYRHGFISLQYIQDNLRAFATYMPLHE